MARLFKQLRAFMLLDIFPDYAFIPWNFMISDNAKKFRLHSR